MVGRAVGRFVLESRTASGGMGVVYQARDTQTGARVAVKMLQKSDDESRARFTREALILAELDHPAIVRYVAHGQTTEAEPYLVMEWVDGETLDARLERSPLTIDESVAAIRRIGEALGHAHARGVLHRDIKPSNLMLPDRDIARISVLDFGIARGPGQAGSLTATGTTLGTPFYMAPEQARGARDLNARVDVFSLGCVLYECVTGRRAFEGRHLLALLAKVAFWEPREGQQSAFGVCTRCHAEARVELPALDAIHPRQRPHEARALTARARHRRMSRRWKRNEPERGRALLADAKGWCDLRAS